MVKSLRLIKHKRISGRDRNNPSFIQLRIFVVTALIVNLHFTKRANAVSKKEYQEHVDIFNCIKAGDEQSAFDTAAKTTKLTIFLVNKKDC